MTVETKEQKKANCSVRAYECECVRLFVCRWMAYIMDLTRTNVFCWRYEIFWIYVVRKHILTFFLCVKAC